MKKSFILSFLAVIFSCATQHNMPQPTDDETISGLQLEKMNKIDGFFRMYWDNSEGKLWLEVDKTDVEFLYINSLATGIGSNDIGLDRGQFGNNRVVKFVRNGPKLFLLELNYAYRAESDNPYEQKAVEESFASSILWGFDIKAQQPGSYIVDATDFFLSDAHNVSGTLERTGQGRYQVDKSKSAINAGNLKGFPENTEVESILTFKGKPEGSYVWRVVPSPELITVHQRHSFVKLPDQGYSLRRYDARSGYFNISYFDFATQFTDPLEKQFIVRHRLDKEFPGQVLSEPVEPIIYYLDPGTPEPVRSALLEGASWWAEAFEAAGFKNAFQVKMLPEDADPMDVRYNMIQWVHRSTRGWSYGHSVIDPRTGEIIKGHVSLGSLRIRQDFLIAQGLLSPYNNGMSDLNAAKEMALARIRQLAAHEVGHTLGLVHNYASSVQDRASVMDYPHPLVRISDDGRLDLRDAYESDIGEWDKQAIRYGYAIFTEHEEDSLRKIINEGLDKGLYFISDKDARPEGSAHPYAHLWDNNANAANELNRLIEIRQLSLKNLGLNSIPENVPVSNLEDVLVPVYLMHRYQLEAASKLVGGLYYTYAYKGDGQVITQMVPAEIQAMALNAILKTIQPEFLEIPESLLVMLPPKALGYDRSEEHFKNKTGLTFDPLAAAESAADLSIRLLLNPERASRLVEYKARNKDLPGLDEVIRGLVDDSWKRNIQNGYQAEINRTVSKLVLAGILQLAQDESASGQARAIALSSLYGLEKWMKTSYEKERDEERKAHILYGIEMVQRFREDPSLFSPAKSMSLPMGSPIGNLMLNCDF